MQQAFCQQQQQQRDTGCSEGAVKHAAISIADTQWITAKAGALQVLQHVQLHALIQRRVMTHVSDCRAANKVGAIRVVTLIRVLYLNSDPRAL